MTIYAYTRVSSNLQTLENQRFSINEFCEKNNINISVWVEETISSRKPLKERKLGKLLKKLKKDDILIATELSRLGRSMMEVMGILNTCLERGTKIWTLKENYRLGDDIQSKALAFAFTLASEIERQLISQRTKESLARLKAEHKHIGRPLGKTSQKLKRKHKKIVELLNKKVSKSEISRLLDCSWSTLQRYIKKSILTASQQ